MGRPQKTGLDYFPLDVHMDDSVELLEVDYGLKGFAILIKLYQKIYNNGYYINAAEREIKLLSRYINVDVELLNNVINATIKYKIFNKKLYNKYQILTSQGIQKRYLFATERRLEVDFIKEFLLLEVNVYINQVNVNINPLNVAETEVNTYIGTHIKEKKSKELNPDYVRVVKYLINYIESNDSKYFKNKNKETLLGKWYDPIRLLVERDGRDILTIKEVIEWCQEDPFWKTNILSTEKLRKQFPTLLMKVTGSKKEPGEVKMKVDDNYDPSGRLARERGNAS